MTNRRTPPTIEQLADAVRIVRTALHWKPGSAVRHLRRRIGREHLPVGTTLTEYGAMIRQIVHHTEAQIYIYWHNQTTPYVAIVGNIDEQPWLVVFNLDGILESAYVVERPHYYLSEPEFELICTLGEAL